MIFTVLQSTNSKLAKPDNWERSIGSNMNCYSSVAKRGPGHAVERGNFLRHLVEQTFDARETILAGDVENEFV